MSFKCGVFPKVSLLVAMRNEADYIERCLESVFAQDYPPDRLEVLVIDGRSSDGSYEIVDRLFRGRTNCYLLRNPQGTQAAGWNLGIVQATGDIIGIVSAHTELAQDYVSEAVETLERTQADMVGGPMRANGQGRVGRAVALATSTPFGVGGARFHYTEREESVDTVYMGLCRREVYQLIGGFDEGMVRNQDDELSYRLLDHGGRIVCNPSVRSHYYNRDTLQSLWRQYFRYGCWKVRVIQKHPRQMRFRHIVPSTLVATLLGTSVLSFFFPFCRLLLVSVVVAYVLANLLVSIWVASKADLHHLLLLPLAFATLHLSYGLGFLKGVLDFVLCRRKRAGTLQAFHSPSDHVGVQ